MPTRKNSKPDFYESVTNQIIEALEAGVKPWVCPWDRTSNSGLPINASTQNPYQGMNIMLLWMSAAEHCFTSQYWLTFKQASEMGGNVRKGEKGTHIFFYKMVQKKGDEGEEETYPMLKTYVVFNLDQIEGLDFEENKPVLNNISLLDEVEAFIDATGAEISYGGAKAFYRPSTDQVVIPTKELFFSSEGMYATILHELVHWTGHKSRLDRDMKGKFGSKDYAFEELVAELGSAFSMASFGLDGELFQHQCYIANWLTALKNDKRYIFKAAAQASKAHQFLLELTEPVSLAMNQ